MPIHYLSMEKFRLIAVSWAALILFLTVCWAALLRRFAEILSARQARHSPTGVPALAGYLLRSGYKQTGDAKLIAVCQKLRNLLFGYFGCIVAFVVFMILMHPRY